MAVNFSNELAKSDNDKREQSGIDEIVYLIVKKLTNDKGELINDVELGKINSESLNQEIIGVIDNERLALKGYTRDEIIKQVQNYLFKYYQYQDLLEDPNVTEVFAVSKDITLVTKLDENKKPYYYSCKTIRFDSNESYTAFCQYVARRNGYELNKRSNILKITDKKRCDNAVLRINLTGSMINSNREVPLMIFAKTPKDKKDLDTLEERGMFNSEIKEYLKMMVHAGVSLIFGGQGGAGKTNIMNALIEEIPEDIRALFIQRDPELFSSKENIFFQEICDDLGEADISYGMKELTINAMKMRTKLIGIGELEGEETFDFFNAGYSGHIVWASIHIESSQEMVPKAIQYIQYSKSNLSEDLLFKMFSTLGVIIYMHDFKTFEITEVAGYDSKEKRILYNPLFKYDVESHKFIRLNQSCERIQNKIRYYEEKNSRKARLVG